jgi:hypothetical protein
MVKVDQSATYATRKYGEKNGVKTLMAKCLTQVDPCCGCVIVEFKANIGTDSTYGGRGVLGHCDEVKPTYLTLAKKPASEADKATVTLGSYVEVTRDYDAAKVGMRGKVVTKAGGEWGILFDTLTDRTGGHSLGGHLGDADRGKGQWVPAGRLRVVPAHKAVEAPKPVKKPFYEELPEGTIKVQFATNGPIKLNSGREVSQGWSYYGWLTTVQDGSTRRQVITAPFSGNEWMTLTPTSKEIRNLSRY